MWDIMYGILLGGGMISGVTLKIMVLFSWQLQAKHIYISLLEI